MWQCHHGKKTKKGMDEKALKIRSNPLAGTQILQQNWERGRKKRKGMMRMIGE